MAKAKRASTAHSPSMVRFFFMGVIVLGIVAGFTYYFLTTVLVGSKASTSQLATQNANYIKFCKNQYKCPATSKGFGGRYAMPLDQGCQNCWNMVYRGRLGEAGSSLCGKGNHMVWTAGLGGEPSDGHCEPNN
jgi:hypothetical protein